MDSDDGADKLKEVKTERQQVIEQVLDAATLEEVEAAISSLDGWMEAHPDDMGMEDGYEQLAIMKEGLLSAGSHACS